MEWSKIKNIVLLMLLAVNLFLLVLVADQERKSAVYQEEARTGAVEILAAANIHMDMEALPPESRLHTMAVERDRTTEDTMAKALLGMVQNVSSGSTMDDAVAAVVETDAELYSAAAEVPNKLYVAYSAYTG